MAKENFYDNIIKVHVTYRHNDQYITFTRYYNANRNTIKISNDIMKELRKISPEAASSATIKIELSS